MKLSLLTTEEAEFVEWHEYWRARAEDPEDETTHSDVNDMVINYMTMLKLIDEYPEHRQRLVDFCPDHLERVRTRLGMFMGARAIAHRCNLSPKYVEEVMLSCFQHAKQGAEA